MINNKLTTRRVLINDAALLKEAGILAGNISVVQNAIRELIVDKSKLSYLVFDDEKLLCLATFLPTSINTTNVRLNIDFSIEKEISDYYESVLKTLLSKAFIDKLFHKLSFYVGVDNFDLAEAAIKCGFIQEAVLHEELVNSEGEYIDAGLFYMLLPEYRGYNVGFLPFQRGIVAVYGTDTYIDRIHIFRYEEKIEDKLALSVAKYIGIADKNGCFLPKNRIEYSEIVDEGSLPLEVEKALFELKEYFLKRRETFDINFKFSLGTSFQQSVWRILSDIPYGVTRSYEEVALMLTSNPTEARKLTRAVGAACSENPIPLIVPCHRVIGKDGKLVGFACGIDMKDFLLQHESLFTTII